MGGPFYSQVFELAQGERVGASSIYVVVYNGGDDTARYVMSGNVPWGVELLFAEESFSLRPGEHKHVSIAIVVSKDAVPGHYYVIAQAEMLAEHVDGQVALVSSVAQRADLTITGESAIVDISVMGPEAKPLAAQIWLFKLIDGKQQECASSVGNLVVRVSPGRYLAMAVADGMEIAQTEFTVESGETRYIALCSQVRHNTWLPFIQ